MGREFCEQLFTAILLGLLLMNELPIDATKSMKHSAI
jgi:hypothetical protein